MWLVRRFCFWLVNHRHFDKFVLFLILVSSVNLMLDEPMANPESGLQLFIYYSDVILAALFAAEMTLKITALGFIGHPVRVAAVRVCA